MKKIISMSLVAATMAFGATSEEIADLQAQIDKLKANQSKIKAHTANDNIKWGVDLRTAVDNINYDLADGRTEGNDALMSMRLLLNMAYAPDSNNIFKGQLSMNKAFGADFGDFDSNRAFSMGSLFDWTGNAALGDNSLRVREAYWLYLGDSAFGLDMPWTFSLGRRPSGTGFLSHLREDDPASSPLAHVINVEFDGLSSKLDLSNITGIPGMSFKVCMGRGSTNATPLFADATPYAENDGLNNIDLAGFIFEPYNDGQFIVKTTWYKAFDLPGMEPEGFNFTTFDDAGNPLTAGIGQSDFKQYGDMQGAAISVLVDGITEDGYFADAKIFGSFAWSKTQPDDGSAMLGSTDSETGTSYWIGAQLPVDDAGKGVIGLEYNHGSQYWRPFTYAEDTMIGSKIAARGDAWEAYFTYQLTDALSAQVRYTDITYDYAGSQGFFGNLSGDATKISDIKQGASTFAALGGVTGPDGVVLSSLATVGQNLGASGMDPAAIPGTVEALAGASLFAQNVVEKAQDFRFYLRYRF
ncbi:MAG: DUF3373 family protein [Campylobacterota bacterium]|nr:DUF3373 family protein [Campylobacterota bacterium]